MAADHLDQQLDVHAALGLALFLGQHVIQYGPVMAGSVLAQLR